MAKKKASKRGGARARGGRPATMVKPQEVSVSLGEPEQAIMLAFSKRFGTPKKSATMRQLVHFAEAAWAAGHRPE